MFRPRYRFFAKGGAALPDGGAPAILAVTGGDTYFPKKIKEETE
jgi:hypothetical protein